MWKLQKRRIYLIFKISSFANSKCKNCQIAWLDVVFSFYKLKVQVMRLCQRMFDELEISHLATWFIFLDHIEIWRFLRYEL